MQKKTKLTVLFLSAVVLVFLSLSFGNVQENYWSNGLQALAIAALAVVILECFWFFAGGNPFEAEVREINESVNDLKSASSEIQEDVVGLSQQLERLSGAIDVVENVGRVGLRAVYDCTGNFGGQSEWLSLIKNSKHEMDLLGRALFEWTRAGEDLDQLIYDKITKDRVKFRWLIMGKNNKYLPLLEEDGTSLAESINHRIPAVIEKIQYIRNLLPDQDKSNLQIKLFENCPLYCSMIRVDTRYLVTPYMFSAGSRGCPLYEIDGSDSPWARSFDREFRTIWTSAFIPEQINH